MQSLALRVGATLAAAGCASVLALAVSAAPAHLGAPVSDRSVTVRADGPAPAPVSTPTPAPVPTPTAAPAGEWNSTG
ncbi:hypothetical protein KSE_58190 [Kitasatospora setae KM-6054]|uniref:Lipoprotein n=2 Tax=Streptomycetaceae TaxID=2062 RepID=E4N3V9_KITSK|nr:hypothetical protein KSE_58190 [Kitasatospora setae KM-6054]